MPTVLYRYVPSVHSLFHVSPANHTDRSYTDDVFLCNAVDSTSVIGTRQVNTVSIRCTVVFRIEDYLFTPVGKDVAFFLQNAYSK